MSQSLAEVLCGASHRSYFLEKVRVPEHTGFRWVSFQGLLYFIFIHTEASGELKVLRLLEKQFM